MPTRPEASSQHNPPLLQRFEPRTPKLEIRLLLWFGIYLAGPLSIVFHGARGGLALLFFFPVLLGNVVVIPLTMLPARFSEGLAPVALGVGWSLSYIVYVLHLIATLRVPTRRRFAWLLLILVALVLLNQLMTRALGPISG